MGLYPYKIRIREIEKLNVYKRLAKDRTVTVQRNGNLFKSIGWDLKPIRRDIFIGGDSRFYENNISLKIPEMKVEILPAYGKRKGKDIIFKL